VASGPDGELPEVPCVGAVVHDEHGRLLLIRRGHAPSRGLWSVPGGRVEAGETGLTVAAGGLLGRVRIPAAGVVFTVADFACRLAHPGQQPVAGDDADDVAWVDAAQLAVLPVTPGLVEALTSWAALPR
jgi:8-oxo-dGTP diphosphatase